MTANVKFDIPADVLLDELKIFTMKQLSIKYKVDRQTIRKHIKIKYKDYNHLKKYSLDENFFQKINTEEKAYWLGFLYADGSVGNKHGYTLQLNLSTIDFNHIEKFRKALNYTGKIKISKRGDSYLHISSKNTVANLISMGCIPNKTLILEFPTEEQVPKYLINHFIRGYFDGDGCLYFKGYSRSFNLIGTEQFLNNISTYFYNELKIPVKIASKIKNKNAFTLTYSSKYDMNIILNHLYKNSIIYLDRKYEKYLEFINYIGPLENLTRRVFHKNCTYSNCNKKHKGHGYCEYHLKHFRKGTL